MAIKRLTTEVSQEMARLYLAGESAPKVAERLGFSKTSVARILRANGVRLRPSGEANARYKFDRDEVVRRYVAGEGIKAIAASLGVPAKVINSTIGNRAGRGQLKRRTAAESRHTVWEFDRDEVVRRYLAGDRICNIAADIGVPYFAVRSTLGNRKVSRKSARQAAYHRRKYAIDESVFDTLNEQSLYWAGFLAADGSVSEDRGVLSLQLQTKDLAHVEAFAGFVKTDAPIELCSTTINGKIHYGYRLTVCSRRLVDVLEGFGIVQNKTYTMRAQGGVEKYADWWRGVVDGDGCLRIARRQNRPSFRPELEVSGAPGLMAQFADFAEPILGYRPRPRKLAWCVCAHRVRFNSNSAVKAIAALYGEECNLALARKWEIAKRILNNWRQP